LEGTVTASEPAGSGDAVLGMLLDLSTRLRRAGVPVALSEKVDAASALGVLLLDDRPLLRAALRSAMIKRVEDQPIFDRLFDRAFPLTGASATSLGSGVDAAGAGEIATEADDSQESTDDGPDGGEISTSLAPTGGAASEQSVDQQLLAELIDALKRGDTDLLQQLAGRFVDEYAGLAGQAGSERAHYYRVLRAADLSNLLTTVMREIRADSPEVMADPFLARMELSEQAQQVDLFRRMIAEQIRDHLDELLAAQGAPTKNRRLEELDMFAASTTDLRQMREVVRPLARKLASKLSQRRRHHRQGRLDMRRTLRHSLNTGGVPMDVKFHSRRSTKPDIVMLCDVSGSVAEFASFTLMLMHAMHNEMARLRTFVFVDGIADVTHTLTNAVDDFDPRFLIHHPGVVVGDGHSDYGGVLATFVREHLATVTPATTVIITGDARTNYRAAGFDDFAMLAARAKRVFWLNPAPRADWDDKDSEISQFSVWCNAVFEVRTLVDLAAAVSAVTA
jgi:uncharacterized protein